MIIEPRGYFASKKRFPNIKIINKWPKEAFKEIKTDQSMALVALTHDPKIYDPAIQHALTKKLTEVRKTGELNWLKPDGKSQVTVEYDKDCHHVRIKKVVIATQHKDLLGQLSTEEEEHNFIKSCWF